MLYFQCVHNLYYHSSESLNHFFLTERSKGKQREEAEQFTSQLADISEQLTELRRTNKDDHVMVSKYPIIEQ